MKHLLLKDPSSANEVYKVLWSLQSSESSKKTESPMLKEHLLYQLCSKCFSLVTYLQEKKGPEQFLKATTSTFLEKQTNPVISTLLTKGQKLRYKF